jgi:metallophosphoesterase superfamily enzyme
MSDDLEKRVKRLEKRVDEIEKNLHESLRLQALKAVGDFKEEFEANTEREKED